MRYSCTMKYTLNIVDTVDNEIYFISDLDIDELKYLYFGTPLFQHEVKVLQNILDTGNCETNCSDRVIRKNDWIDFLEEEITKSHNETVQTSYFIQNSIIMCPAEEIIVNGTNRHSLTIHLNDLSPRIKINYGLKVLYMTSVRNCSTACIKINEKDLQKIDILVTDLEVPLSIDELNNNLPIVFPKGFDVRLVKVFCDRFSLCNLKGICDAFSHIYKKEVLEGSRVRQEIHLYTDLYDIEEWFDYIINKEINLFLLENGRILEWLLSLEDVSNIYGTENMSSTVFKAEKFKLTLSYTSYPKGIADYVKHGKDKKVLYKNKIISLHCEHSMVYVLIEEV